MPRAHNIGSIVIQKFDDNSYTLQLAQLDSDSELLLVAAPNSPPRFRHMYDYCSSVLPTIGVRMLQAPELADLIAAAHASLTQPEFVRFRVASQIAGCAMLCCDEAAVAAIAFLAHRYNRLVDIGCEGPDALPAFPDPVNSVTLGHWAVDTLELLVRRQTGDVGDSILARKASMEVAVLRAGLPPLVSGMGHTAATPQNSILPWEER